MMFLFAKHLNFGVLGIILHLLTSGSFAAVGQIDASRINDEPLTLAPYFAVLEDPDRVLTLADVQSHQVADRFKLQSDAGNSLGFGLSRSAYWRHLNVRFPDPQGIVNGTLDQTEDHFGTSFGVAKLLFGQVG